MVKHLFVVGAQRSATTYLYHTLASHPQVEMNAPAKPEPKFFLEPGSEMRRQEYIGKFFGRKESAQIYGEKSTSYIESWQAASRIAALFPDARIIIMLRDPVLRAISNYSFSVANGVEDRGIEVLMDETAQSRNFGKFSVSPFAYLDRGRYSEYIDIYSEYFPSRQMMLIEQSQFVGNTGSIKELYAWLGIDTSHLPACLNEKINSSYRAELHVPEEVRNFLREYYERPNRQLKQKYNVDISLWHSERGGGSEVDSKRLRVQPLG